MATLSERPFSCFFFFNDTATTEIYTLSLHDALPIFLKNMEAKATQGDFDACRTSLDHLSTELDRKSTRLNSSHLVISYAVFCLKKKKNATNACSQTNRQLRGDNRHAHRDPYDLTAAY